MPFSDATKENPYALPEGLPVPVDDGSAKHLLHSKLPQLALRATNGRAVDLASLKAPTVLFFYPRTGVPGEQPNRGFGGENWDDIPGARGCTPQNCAFRDSRDAWVRLAQV